MIPLFSTKIDDNGKLVEPSGLDYKNYVDSLKGKRVDLTIEPYKTKRSLDQNALMWVWLEVIARDTGYTKTELHETFKRLFLEPKIMEYRGKKFKVPRSTTELGISEMSEYMRQIEREAGELGILLPTEDQIKL